MRALNSNKFDDYNNFLKTNKIYYKNFKLGFFLAHLLALFLIKQSYFYLMTQF